MQDDSLRTVKNFDPWLHLNFILQSVNSLSNLSICKFSSAATDAIFAGAEMMGQEEIFLSTVSNSQFSVKMLQLFILENKSSLE